MNLSASCVAYSLIYINFRYGPSAQCGVLLVDERQLVVVGLAAPSRISRITEPIAYWLQTDKLLLRYRVCFFP